MRDRQARRRDATTRAAYAYAGTWGWFLYGFGPAIALLRVEQEVSRSAAALHSVALAAGALVAGTAGLWVVRRWGRRAAMVGGALTVVVGVFALVSTTLLPVTLAATLVAGVGGGTALNSMSPVLAAHHHETPSAALGEANGVAAVLGVLSPLAVGLAVSIGWGWRPAVLVTALLALGTVILIARAPGSAAWDGRRAARIAGADRMDRTFWTCWAMLVACIGVEFATTFWAVDLLSTDKGLDVGTASACLAAFTAGMAVARLSTGALSRRWPDEWLLLAALVVSGCGWALLWGPPSPAVAVAGLALAGLGGGLHFPVGLTLLMRASGGQSDTATGYASIGVGIASGGAPFLLGAVADVVGTRSAFLVVPVLVAIAITLLVAVLRRVSDASQAVSATAPG